MLVITSDQWKLFKLLIPQNFYMKQMLEKYAKNTHLRVYRYTAQYYLHFWLLAGKWLPPGQPATSLAIDQLSTVLTTKSVKFHILYHLPISWQFQSRFWSIITLITWNIWQVYGWGHQPGMQTCFYGKHNYVRQTFKIQICLSLDTWW